MIHIVFHCIHGTWATIILPPGICRTGRTGCHSDWPEGKSERSYSVSPKKECNKHAGMIERNATVEVILDPKWSWLVYTCTIINQIWGPKGTLETRTHGFCFLSKHSMAETRQMNLQRLWFSKLIGSHPIIQIRTNRTSHQQQLMENVRTCDDQRAVHDYIYIHVFTHICSNQTGAGFCLSTVFVFSWMLQCLH